MSVCVCVFLYHVVEFSLMLVEIFVIGKGYFKMNFEQISSEIRHVNESMFRYKPTYS
jgi:hypothetical protein